MVRHKRRISHPGFQALRICITMSFSRSPGWSSSAGSFGSSRSMASSRSLSARSGSFTVGKGITSLALDALKFAMDGAEIKQEGDLFVHLQSELGERRYSKLLEDVDLSLDEIHYCQEGLDIMRINQGQEVVSAAQSEQMKQMKDMINHDYLVLKLRPGEPKAEVLHIMAHKLRGGIHITHIPSSEVAGVFHEGVRCYTVNCGKKRMRLEALLAILKEEDPDYSLRNANCWDYAKNTAKRLVKGCVDAPGISSAEKVRLQKEHDSLEANLAFRHMQNVAKSLLRNFSTRARVSAPSPSPSPSRRLNSSEGLVNRLPQVMELLSVASPASSPLSKLIRASTSLAPSNSSEGLVNRLPQLVELISDALPANSLRASTSSERFMDRSPQVEELSMDAAPSSRLLSSSSRLPQVVDLSTSSEVVDDFPRSVLSEPRELKSVVTESSREAEVSSAPAPPLASTGKLCLQILFLLLCIIINSLGLGPWASSLLRGSG